MDKEERLIMDFRDLYNKMNWLNKAKMEDRFRGYKSSEIHCIEYIGKHEDPNVTELAGSFYVTRGAMTKMTKKLIKKGVAESYRKPDNKKEVYFRLTEQGKTVSKAHEKLHKEFRERDKAVFAQLTEEQFRGMLEFMETYSRHLDAEIGKQNAD
ncbi:MAG: MarR family transcriptional regulator [Clostridiales Family XIII bacterium]|jgi:DNA-binding MarR family transcriptional regulator|nr:MarR family transcriptional regulator [Clostridiales Family XIII bacterium]